MMRILSSVDHFTTTMRTVTLELLILTIVQLLDLNVCQHDVKKDWWRTTSIYQVYPPSFKDSNSDGVGDIKGITSKLEHFVDIGIETVWLNPFYKSPNADMGYDISDFCSVDPVYGTMEDCDEMVRKMKSLGLKFMIDFVPNHSSDEHEWFNKSVYRNDPYTEYYVWEDPNGYDKSGKPIPPNNWISVFNGPAWEWNEKRKQFYLHQFTVKQPDFNLRNPILMEELKEVIRFWINKGADAIRIDAAKHFVEDAQLRNESYITSKAEMEKSQKYSDMYHIYTTDLEESYDVIHQLREFVESEFSSKDGYTRPLIAEVYTDMEHLMLYYDRDEYKITHFPFNFQLVTLSSLAQFPNAYDVFDCIQKWMNYMDNGRTPNWVAENHDNPRVTDKFSREFSGVVNMMVLLLPGVSVTYYGSEIGMEDATVRPDQRKDTVTDPTLLLRDPERSPMQWDDSQNAGFTTTSKPWLPVNSNYWHINVETEKHDQHSHYNVYKNLSRLRTKPTIKYGIMNIQTLSKWVLAFTREYIGYETYIVVLNVGTETEAVDLPSVFRNLPKRLQVAVATINAGYEQGHVINTKLEFPCAFVMRPKSGLVLTTANVNDLFPANKDPTNDSRNGASQYRIQFIFLASIILYVFLHNILYDQVI